jgi:hypothetical protein
MGILPGSRIVNVDIFHRKGKNVLKKNQVGQLNSLENFNVVVIGNMNANIDFL